MTLKLNGSSSGSVALDAPASTTSGADIAFNLPVADGTAGQVLQTDGSGNWSWTTVSVTTGPTVIDTWRITADVTIPNAHITSNWARATDTLTAQLGSAVTESSGVFTMPSTGIYRLTLQIECYDSTTCRWIEGRIDGSTDGFSSNTTTLATGYTSIYDDSNNVHSSLRTSTYYDVTNTSNNKVKVYIGDAGNAAHESHADKNVSWIEFVKVAET